jgi:hypothetical protein
MGDDRNDNGESEFRNIPTMQVDLVEDEPSAPFSDGGVPSSIESTAVRKSPYEDEVDALPPGIRGCLTILQGPNKGQEYYLSEVTNTVGRRVGNSVVLDDATISGKHVEIYFSAYREWRIRDLNSTNGTLLNGSRVKEFALRDGDKILIGDCMIHFTVDVY